MKVFKGLLATLLVLIIIGGVGYIVYSQFYMKHGEMNMGAGATPAPSGTTQNQQASNQQGMDMQGMNMGGTNNVPNIPGLNTISMQNRDRLASAIGTINQAMDLITIDPYSKATLPSTNPNMQPGAIQPGTMQPGQGSNINIYPNGTNSVNINPNGTGNTTGTTTVPNTSVQPGTFITPPQSYVYDQGKLEQVHTGIYSLAQGMALINDLNNDLLSQSAIIETDLYNYQTYVNRYNIAFQDKSKLANAMSLLKQASILINVNPYASAYGYAYDATVMKQIHQGIYQLAQGMAMLNSLSDNFTSQMLQAATQAQNIVYSMYSGSSMNMNMGMSGNINFNSILNIIIIVMVVGLIAGILGAIFSIFRRKPEIRNNGMNRSDAI